MEQLFDTFGRVVNYLRISVTDRCNLRCQYCMPADGVPWVPKQQVLSFEEMVRIVRVMSGLGISNVRITGGEPLVRRGLPELIEQFSRLTGVDDISLTTNGVLLAPQAHALFKAGLGRINISLDSLRPDSFASITRANLFGRIKEGIEAASEAGFNPIKLNMVVIRGVNDDEIADFARLTRHSRFEVRFLEYMPLDGYGNWDRTKLVSGAEILERLRAVGELESIQSVDRSEVAQRFRLRGHHGEIGLILPVTQPFCANCSRLRVTAEGFIKNCLFGQEEWNLRDLIRAGGSDDEIRAMIRLAVLKKKAALGGLDLDFDRSARNMSQIGG
jgi:GTP 3',8-cyclase